MKKLKVAVVGVGSISKYHIQGYLASPDVELYAFCDINEGRLKEKGETYGITRLYTDEAKMLAELPEIDLVSVCTWNCAHAACSIMALNAGKHVLCEKPMAMNVEEALAMKEAAERNNKLLMIGFVRRFGRDCRVVTDLIEHDRLGDIYYAKAQYLRSNGNPGGWFGNTALSGGGPLIDLGVHSIDLVRYLMGKKKVVSVYGATFEKLGNRPHIKTGKAYRSSSTESGDVCDCEDLATAMIRFEDGSVLNVEVSFSLNIGGEETNVVQLFGTKAGVSMTKEIRMFSEMDGYLTNTEVGKGMGFDFEPSFTAEIAHFIACAKGEVECRNTAEDGVEMMKILCAIYRSAKSGHEETLA